MNIYCLTLSMCLIVSAYSDVENKTASDATEIYTKIVNYIQNTSDTNAIDASSKSSVPKIHSLFVIMPNDTLEHEEKYDQTFVLSKNSLSPKTETDSTLNIQNNLRFKVTEIIGVDNIVQGKPNHNSKLDMASIEDNLRKHFAQKDSNFSEKLRSIIIKKRILNNTNLNQPIENIQDPSIETKAFDEKTMNKQYHLSSSYPLDSLNNFTSGINIIFKHPKPAEKQVVENLKMIPFTIEDAMIPAESVVHEYITKPEKKNIQPLVPDNHATVYRPVTNIHQLSLQNFSPDMMFMAPNTNFNKKDLKVVIKNGKIQYTQQYEDIQNPLMAFISKIFEPLKYSHLSATQQIKYGPTSPTEKLLVVGPVPKPLPSHLVYEPYKTQLVLPKELVSNKF